MHFFYKRLCPNLFDTYCILQIAKDARECVQECVSEFISFITSEASDRCHMEKRKTINGEDILFAMSTLGFDNYVEPLKIYLQKYREVRITDGFCRRYVILFNVYRLPKAIRICIQLILCTKKFQMKALVSRMNYILSSSKYKTV